MDNNTVKFKDHSEAWANGYLDYINHKHLNRYNGISDNKRFRDWIAGYLACQALTELFGNKDQFGVGVK